MLPDAGETVTVATGTGAAALTVIGALPVLVSLVAVIVALPGPAAVTNPSAETALTAVLLEIHVIGRPVRTLLLASYVVAVAWVVLPGLRVLTPSDTCTEATGIALPPVEVGGVTATVALPDLYPRDALMTADPAPTPVTRPEELTVATDVSLDDQVTTRVIGRLL